VRALPGKIVDRLFSSTAVKAFAEALGVARSGLARSARDPALGRRGRPPVPEHDLLARINGADRRVADLRLPAAPCPAAPASGTGGLATSEPAMRVG
jgi:hypothetical protein